MRLLILFALIGLSVAVPVYEVNDNFGVCDICKGAVGVLLELVKIGASQDIIDEKIGDICPSIPIISSICKEALKKAVKYLREHLDKADANTVCKAIHACNNKHTFIVVNW
ncbi:unnamed protein product [Calicophoron daubneyi]|uniref:Saposin B-type domain-containing protein n=1 Tax=Calicophoron daubneyi TaxID=300641 RepID=A0AAV2SZ66_CALDB